MSRTIESAYRVYYFAKELIESWRSTRDRQRQTNPSFVSDATDKHLAVIVKELRSIGMTGMPSERYAVRLEVPLATLADLSDGSEATGVPSSTLLSICLARASATKPKRRSRKG
jgi:hypothetical protein